MSEDNSTKIVLSGYVTEGEGTRLWFECINGHFSQRNDLESNVEEADGQLVGHIWQVLMTGIKGISIFSNDTDIAIFLYQMHEFFRRGVQEVWIKFGKVKGAFLHILLRLFLER